MTRTLIGLLVVMATRFSLAAESDSTPQKKPSVGPEPAEVIAGKILIEGRVPQPKPGGVTDETILVDPATGGLANVVIVLESVPSDLRIPKAPEKAAKIVIKGGRFVPHVLVARTGQRIEFSNEDPQDVNVRNYPARNRHENFLVTPKAMVAVNLSTPEKRPFKVDSETHPWMQAYQLVVDHPWAAVSDSKGAFKISGLPTGTYRFKIWHERVGLFEKSLAIDVKAGHINELTLVYPARLLQP